MKKTLCSVLICQSQICRPSTTIAEARSLPIVPAKAQDIECHNLRLQQSTLGTAVLKKSASSAPPADTLTAAPAPIDSMETILPHLLQAQLFHQLAHSNDISVINS